MRSQVIITVGTGQSIGFLRLSKYGTVISVKPEHQSASPAIH